MMKDGLRRIAAFIVIVIIAWGSLKGLHYILVDDTASYTRLMMHELYEQEGIDILCLGPSNCYRGVIPSVVGEKTNKSVFNASTSSQAPDASLALLKEASRRYKIQEVYLEISATIAQEVGEYKKRKGMTSTYLVSDYLRPSLNKLGFLLGASASKYYVNSFVPARRYWAKLLDLQYIDSLVQKKQTAMYREYAYDLARGKREWYAGKGYVASNQTVQEHRYYSKDGSSPIDTDLISEDWKKTISTIIAFCNQRNIKLTLYASPISAFQLSAEGNYDEYISFIHNFIEGKDVRYVDYNLLKEEYLPYVQSNYKDGHHLNMYGAEAFSEFLAKDINGNISQEAYYSSVNDKLDALPPDYYGISYRDNKTKETRHFQLVSNHKGYFEYKVEVITAEGENVLLQDFETNNELDVPDELLARTETAKATVVVTYRKAGSDEIGQRVEY